jgi:tetratricopeptide (TPR) repeat protein
MDMRMAALAVLVAGTVASRGARGDALEGWARAIAEHPEDARGYEGFAMAAMAERRWDEAIAQLRAGVGRVAGFARGYYLLAVAYKSRGEWAEAASYFRICVTLGQQVNDARYGLGRALAELGDRAGAIEALRRYVADERDPAKARFVEAARVELSRLEAVAREPAAAPVADEADIEAANQAANEADRLQAAGRFEEAVAAYRRAIAVAPDDARLRNELGASLFQLRRFSEAADAFQAAVDRDRGYAVAWFNLGNALRNAGRAAFAVSAGERFVELAPADPDGWFALAESHDASGDPKGALAAYQSYLALEKRPDRERLVARARNAVAALEARTAAADPYQSDAVMPFVEERPAGDARQRRFRDLRDPFGALDGPGGGDDLMNPFSAGARRPRAMLDPFGEASATEARGRREGDDASALSVRNRAHAAALSAYRRALAAHIERVTVRYEKGVALSLAGRAREAAAAFDAVPLDDAALADARQKLERLRDRGR